MADYYPLKACQSLSLCRTLVRRGWDEIDSPVGDGEALRTPYIGVPLVLRCSKDTVSLTLLRHPWSGAARISASGFETTVSLGAETIGEVTVALPAYGCHFEVTIESLLVDVNEPQRHEVWLLGVTFGPDPLPPPRSVILNESTKIVYGDWGEFLAFRGDNVLPEIIAETGSWAAEDIALFAEHVTPGGLVIDVGANIGHHSVVLSRLVGDEGLVIAIEAQRALHQIVQANALLNRRWNIVPVHSAAGATDSTISMQPVNYDDNFSFGTLGVNVGNVDYGQPGEEVACRPLDAIVREHGGGRKVDFIKIDVQAYELFVLQGMPEILANHRPKIFVEISPYWMRQFGYEFTEIYTLLTGYGYTLIHREGLALGPAGYPQIPEDSLLEWDLLAIHPEQPR